MSIFSPIIESKVQIFNKGFDKGPSYNPVVPIKKVTFVNHNEESLLDDYSYLAAIPTAVFNENDKLVSHPLIFFQDEYLYETDAHRTLNANEGIKYFMEDWMSYSSGKLDQMTLINMNKNKLDREWDAKEYVVVEYDDPYKIANELALNDWSYSDEAVLAVIDGEFDDINKKTSGEIEEKLVFKEIKSQSIEIPQTNHLNPQYETFNVPEGYKFLRARSWYPSFYFSFGLESAGFDNLINMTIPPGDRDIQLYCKYNGEWMLAQNTISWNTKDGMDLDKCDTYVYSNGDWKLGLTDVPTKSPFPQYSKSITLANSNEPQKHRNFLGILKFGRYGSILGILQSIRETKYQIDIDLYPGKEFSIPEPTPFGCRNAEFKLLWDNPNVKLGFSLIGPYGEEVYYGRDENKKQEQIINIEKLGECVNDERYKICVYPLNEYSGSVEFKVLYSWNQNYSKKDADSLASATEGAVLASLLNAPMLYVSDDKVLKSTKDVINKLGVKKIHYINLGSHASSNIVKDLSSFASVKKYNQYKEIYDKIASISNKNDIIFSTIDPYTYWYVSHFNPPVDEYNAALNIGPAAYIAAHHGSPVFIVDNHPELSKAISYTTNLWNKYPDGNKVPTVASMYLSGKPVYEFLSDLDFDKEGMETMITVAGQFDIGIPWDRIFTGKAKPGRFIGSPVDTSVCISRSVFYPALIFENPAIKGSVNLINGSESRRAFPYWSSLGLRITKQSEEETFTNPVLTTLVCYEHRFNERAGKYFGFKYKCADGTIPGESSYDFGLDIDVGVNEKYLGELGAAMPDLCGSEVVPFYLKRAGYTPVYSTNFEANMHNLNQGVILWMLNTHGANTDGGLVMFWDPDSEAPLAFPAIPGTGAKKEKNPWRGYEWLMGSTEEPDTMTADIHGIIPSLLGNPYRNGLIRSALDWAPAKKPILDKISKLTNLPIIRHIAPEWLKDVNDYYDGVICTVFLTRFFTGWFNGTQIDNELKNLHSCGVSSVACLPAGKYLHLSLMRHGSVFQIMDPWSTSWYSDVWQNMIPRGLAIGHTIGDAFTEGLKKVGILYITDPPQWWWDTWENVELFGDPDLRVYVPGTEYSDENYWEKSDVKQLNYDPETNINGHMPFGATSYPNENEDEQLMSMLIYVVIIVFLFVISIIIVKKKRRNKK
jgi:hypothetical protein